MCVVGCGQSVRFHRLWASARGGFVHRDFCSGVCICLVSLPLQLTPGYVPSFLAPPCSCERSLCCDHATDHCAVCDSTLPVSGHPHLHRDLQPHAETTPARYPLRFPALPLVPYCFASRRVKTSSFVANVSAPQALSKAPKNEAHMCLLYVLKRSISCRSVCRLASLSSFHLFHSVISQIYARNQRQSVESFFLQNGYIEYKSLQRLQVIKRSRTM